jgi:hypothetical protein
MVEHRIGPRHIIMLALLVAAMLPGSAESQDYQHEIDRLAGEVANTAAKAGLKNIAVTDFTDLKGNVQEMGRFIAEELTTSLVLSERPFKTIDRANLRMILEEQKLSMTGLMSPENAKKLRVSGVDGLVRGTLTPFGESFRLTIQVIAVENAQIVGAARGTVPKTNAMESLGDAIESASPTGGQSQGQATSTKKGKTIFQDKYLRITLRYFRKDTADRIKAIFLIENITASDLSLIWREPQAIDDVGEQWRLVERSGIGESGSYATLTSPGSPITVLLVFKLEKGTSRATRFNIIGPIEVSDGTRWTTSSPTFQDAQPGS